MKDHRETSPNDVRPGPPPIPGGSARPIPVIPLNYRTAELPHYAQVENWAPLARFATTPQWHQARAALGRGRIEALMGGGEDVADSNNPAEGEGVEMLVPASEISRARLILEAFRNGDNWCPRCGSRLLQSLHVPWWWTIFSLLFLGLAPFSPPRFACKNCGNRWE